MSNASAPLLQVQGLSTHLPTASAVVRAVQEAALTGQRGLGRGRGGRVGPGGTPGRSNGLPRRNQGHHGESKLNENRR